MQRELNKIKNRKVMDKMMIAYQMNQPVNKTDAAKFLGVSTYRINEWINAGMPCEVDRRGKKPKIGIYLGLSIDWVLRRRGSLWRGISHERAWECSQMRKLNKTLSD